MTHPARLAVDRLLSDCKITRGRRSGPGGQHRNKVETAIRIRHLPSGITAEATERRSQEENRQEAIFRLRLQLAVRLRSEQTATPEVPPSAEPASTETVSTDSGSAGDVAEPPSPPSSLWRRRCVSGRIEINARHADFPAVLAEALDGLERADYRMRPAAEALECSASQLTRLLRRVPEALQAVNRARVERGLRPLR